VVDFLFAITEHFSLALTARVVELGVFLKGMSQFKRKFQVEGDIADQPMLVSEN